MPQTSLYITDQNLATLRSRSAEEGLSVSRYVNYLIEQDAHSGDWPTGFWDLYGAITDESFVAPPRPSAKDDTRQNSSVRTPKMHHRTKWY